jgi:hypothetical protein
MVDLYHLIHFSKLPQDVVVTQSVLIHSPTVALTRRCFAVVVFEREDVQNNAITLAVMKATRGVSSKRFAKGCARACKPARECRPENNTNIITKVL